jgi:hypothetical protein
MVITSEAAKPEKESPPWSPEVTVAENPEFTLVKAELPGRSRANSILEDQNGKRSLLFLVEREDEPNASLRLFNMDPSGQTPLLTMREDLSPATRTLFTMDLDGDGVQQPLIGMPGGLHSLPPEGEPRLMLETAAFTPLQLNMWITGAGEPSTRNLAISGVGFLRHYRLDNAEGRFVLHREHRLPVNVTRTTNGLWLRTPRPVALAGREEGPPLFAVGPEAHDRRRLRTLLIDPEAGEEAGYSLEAWSRFDEPEEVRQRWFLTIDDRPALVVTSVLADRKGIFEKKKLRVFLLATDRTRGGTEPILSVKTSGRQWYRSGAAVTDLNADGMDDLVILMPEGLGGGKFLIEAYLGREDGRFHPKPRHTLLDLSADRWNYGADVNDDGIADLVIVEDDSVAAYSGIGDRSTDGVIEKEPMWKVGAQESNEAEAITAEATTGDVVVEGGYFRGEIEVVDLVGDSRAEVVVISWHPEDDRSLVRIILPK